MYFWNMVYSTFVITDSLHVDAVGALPVNEIWLIMRWSNDSCVTTINNAYCTWEISDLIETILDKISLLPFPLLQFRCYKISLLIKFRNYHWRLVASTAWTFT